jgi:hypothetical protein
MRWLELSGRALCAQADCTVSSQARLCLNTALTFYNCAQDQIHTMSCLSSVVRSVCIEG